MVEHISSRRKDKSKMSKTNGTMIVVCSVLALTLSHVALGVASSPDGFEGYTPTADWQPTQGVEGWVLSDLFEDFFAFDWKGEIKSSAVSPNTSQVLSVIPREVLPYDMQGGLVSTWHKSLPDSGSDVTYTSWDIAPIGNVLGDQWLMHVTRLNDNSLPPGWDQMDEGNQSWQVGIVSSYFGGHDPDHEAMAYLQTLTAEGTWVEALIPGIDMTEFAPGNVGTNYGKWFTAEVQEDNLLSKTRARIYETGTSPGAEDGWTSWLDHHASLHGLDYSTGGKVIVRSQGFMEYDNFRMADTAPGGLVGDINGDGQVDGLDLNLLGADWQSTSPVTPAADINGDGIVDGLDLNILGSNWQLGVPAPATIPEPTTLSLLGVGALAMMRRRTT
jgi:hypothetical protein